MAKSKAEALIVLGDAPVTLMPYQRTDVVTVLDPVSMTKQSFADECDINNIMRRYEKDGVLQHLNKYEGNFGDFTGAVEYHEAMGIVARADQMFMDLPASIRAQFGNDAGAFVEFATNPKNEDKLIEMGLAHPRKDVDTPAVAAPPAPVKQENKDVEVQS